MNDQPQSNDLVNAKARTRRVRAARPLDLTVVYEPDMERLLRGLRLLLTYPLPGDDAAGTPSPTSMPSVRTGQAVKAAS